MTSHIEGLEVEEVIFCLLDAFEDPSSPEQVSINSAIHSFAIAQFDLVVKAIFSFLEVRRTSATHQLALLRLLGDVLQTQTERWKTQQKQKQLKDERSFFSGNEKKEEKGQQEHRIVRSSSRNEGGAGEEVSVLSLELTERIGSFMIREMILIKQTDQRHDALREVLVFLAEMHSDYVVDKLLAALHQEMKHENASDISSGVYLATLAKLAQSRPEIIRSRGQDVLVHLLPLLSEPPGVSKSSPPKVVLAETLAAVADALSSTVQIPTAPYVIAELKRHAEKQARIGLPSFCPFDSMLQNYEELTGAGTTEDSCTSSSGPSSQNGSRPLSRRDSKDIVEPKELNGQKEVAELMSDEEDDEDCDDWRRREEGDGDGSNESGEVVKGIRKKGNDSLDTRNVNISKRKKKKEKHNYLLKEREGTFGKKKLIEESAAAAAAAPHSCDYSMEYSGLIGTAFDVLLHDWMPQAEMTNDPNVNWPTLQALGHLAQVISTTQLLQQAPVLLESYVVLCVGVLGGGKDSVMGGGGGLVERTTTGGGGIIGGGGGGCGISGASPLPGSRFGGSGSRRVSGSRRGLGGVNSSSGDIGMMGNMGNSGSTLGINYAVASMSGFGSLNPPPPFQVLKGLRLLLQRCLLVSPIVLVPQLRCLFVAIFGSLVALNAEYNPVGDFQTTGVTSGALASHMEVLHCWEILAACPECLKEAIYFLVAKLKPDNKDDRLAALVILKQIVVLIPRETPDPQAFSRPPRPSCHDTSRRGSLKSFGDFSSVPPLPSSSLSSYSVGIHRTAAAGGGSNVGGVSDGLPIDGIVGLFNASSISSFYLGSSPSQSSSLSSSVLSSTPSSSLSPMEQLLRTVAGLTLEHALDFSVAYTLLDLILALASSHLEEWAKVPPPPITLATGKSAAMQPSSSSSGEVEVEKEMEERRRSNERSKDEEVGGEEDMGKYEALGGEVEFVGKSNEEGGEKNFVVSESLNLPALMNNSNSKNYSKRKKTRNSLGGSCYRDREQHTWWLSPAPFVAEMLTYFVRLQAVPEVKVQQETQKLLQKQQSRSRQGGVEGPTLMDLRTRSEQILTGQLCSLVPKLMWPLLVDALSHPHLGPAIPTICECLAIVCTEARKVQSYTNFISGLGFRGREHLLRKPQEVLAWLFVYAHDPHIRPNQALNALQALRRMVPLIQQSAGESWTGSPSSRLQRLIATLQETESSEVDDDRWFRILAEELLCFLQMCRKTMWDDQPFVMEFIQALVDTACELRLDRFDKQSEAPSELHRAAIYNMLGPCMRQMPSQQLLNNLVDAFLGTAPPVKEIPSAVPVAVVSSSASLSVPSISPSSLPSSSSSGVSFSASSPSSVVPPSHLAAPCGSASGSLFPMAGSYSSSASAAASSTPTVAAFLVSPGAAGWLMRDLHFGLGSEMMRRICARGVGMAASSQRTFEEVVRKLTAISKSELANRKVSSFSFFGKSVAVVQAEQLRSTLALSLGFVVCYAPSQFLFPLLEHRILPSTPRAMEECSSRTGDVDEGAISDVSSYSNSLADDSDETHSTGSLIGQAERAMRTALKDSIPVNEAEYSKSLSNLLDEGGKLPFLLEYVVVPLVTALKEEKELSVQLSILSALKLMADAIGSFIAEVCDSELNRFGVRSTSSVAPFASHVQLYRSSPFVMTSSHGSLASSIPNGSGMSHEVASANHGSPLSSTLIPSSSICSSSSFYRPDKSSVVSRTSLPALDIAHYTATNSQTTSKHFILPFGSTKTNICGAQNMVTSQNGTCAPLGGCRDILLQTLLYFILHPTCSTVPPHMIKVPRYSSLLSVSSQLREELLFQSLNASAAVQAGGGSGNSGGEGGGREGGGAEDSPISVGHLPFQMTFKIAPPKPGPPPPPSSFSPFVKPTLQTISSLVTIPPELDPSILALVLDTTLRLFLQLVPASLYISPDNSPSTDGISGGSPSGKHLNSASSLSSMSGSLNSSGTIQSSSHESMVNRCSSSSKLSSKQWPPHTGFAGKGSSKSDSGSVTGRRMGALGSGGHDIDFVEALKEAEAPLAECLEGVHDVLLGLLRHVYSWLGVSRMMQAVYRVGAVCSIPFLRWSSMRIICGLACEAPIVRTRQLVKRSDGSKVTESGKSLDEKDGRGGVRWSEDWGEWSECLALLLPRLGDSCGQVATVAREATNQLLARCEWTHQCLLSEKSFEDQVIPPHMIVTGASSSDAVSCSSSSSTEAAEASASLPLGGETTRRLKKSLSSERTGKGRKFSISSSSSFATSSSLALTTESVSLSAAGSRGTSYGNTAATTSSSRSSGRKTNPSVLDLKSPSPRPSHRLAFLLAERLPIGAIPSLVQHLLPAMHDGDASAASSAMEALKILLKARGQELPEEYAAKLMSTIFEELFLVHDISVRIYALHCIRVLGRSHFQAVAKELLEVGPNFEIGHIEALTLLGKDRPLLVKALSHLTDILNNSDPGSGEENNDEMGSEKQTGGGNPIVLSATVALGYLLEVDDSALKVVVHKHFAELFSTLLLRVGTCQGFKTQGAYSAAKTLRNLLMAAEDEVLIIAFDARGFMARFQRPNSYDEAIAELMALFLWHNREKCMTILNFTAPFLSRPFVGHIIASTVMLAQIPTVQASVLKQDDALEKLTSCFCANCMDHHEPTIRKHLYRGLRNLLCLWNAPFPPIVNSSSSAAGSLSSGPPTLVLPTLVPVLVREDLAVKGLGCLLRGLEDRSPWGVQEAVKACLEACRYDVEAWPSPACAALLVTLTQPRRIRPLLDHVDPSIRLLSFELLTEILHTYQSDVSSCSSLPSSPSEATITMATGVEGEGEEINGFPREKFVHRAKIKKEHLHQLLVTLMVHLEDPQAGVGESAWCCVQQALHLVLPDHPSLPALLNHPISHLPRRRSTQLRREKFDKGLSSPFLDCMKETAADETAGGEESGSSFSLGFGELYNLTEGGGVRKAFSSSRRTAEEEAIDELRGRSPTSDGEEKGRGEEDEERGRREKRILSVKRMDGEEVEVYETPLPSNVMEEEDEEAKEEEEKTQRKGEGGLQESGKRGEEIRNGQPEEEEGGETWALLRKSATCSLKRNTKERRQNERSSRVRRSHCRVPNPASYKSGYQDFVLQVVPLLLSSGSAPSPRSTTNTDSRSRRTALNGLVEDESVDLAVSVSLEEFDLSLQRAMLLLKTCRIYFHPKCWEVSIEQQPEIVEQQQKDEEKKVRARAEQILFGNLWPTISESSKEFSSAEKGGRTKTASGKGEGKDVEGFFHRVGTLLGVGASSSPLARSSSSSSEYGSGGKGGKERGVSGNSSYSTSSSLSRNSSENEEFAKRSYHGDASTLILDMFEMPESPAVKRWNAVKFYMETKPTMMVDFDESDRPTLPIESLFEGSAVLATALVHHIALMLNKCPKERRDDDDRFLQVEALAAAVCK